MSNSPAIDQHTNTLDLDRSKEPFADHDFSFKIIFVGDAGVGKTCIIKRIEKDDFTEAHEVTLGGDFANVFYWVNHKKAKVQYWDTCGLELYRSMIKLYFKGADASIITFDLTSENSFYNAQKWLIDIRENVPPSSSIYLVGNKSDLTKRAIPTDLILEFVSLSKLDGFFETSAKTSDGIQHLVLSIINDLYTKTLKAEEKEAKIIEDKKKMLEVNNKKVKNKKCC